MRNKKPGERVLILAPTGRDGPLIADMLSRAGYDCDTFQTLPDLCAELLRETGIVGIEDEVLTPEGLRLLKSSLLQQPHWSDIPFVVFARRGRAPVNQSVRERDLKDLGNFTVLERPLYPSTLVTAIDSALRARLRQYELRTYLEEREKDHEKISELNRELEKRVQERTEEALQAKQAFYEAQKLEAIGRLAGGVAHDFNNLITGILGVTEEVRDALGPESPLRADLEEVIQAGKRASDLTRQLLAFGRRQVVAPKIMNVNVVIEAMNRIFQRLIGENVHVEMHLSPTLGNVSADPGHIEQVVLNLIINSRDAMPQGGKIILQTENVDLAAPLHQGAFELKPGHYVLLTVWDNGSGMTPETLSHMFEPFFTTKAQGKGTGLGLSTVYGIVKQSRGNLRVESELGKGTIFRIYLPRAMSELESESRLPASVNSGGIETILIVEDEDIVRRVVRKTLRNRGYTIFEARNGQEALQLVEQHKVPIHLLLTDVVMPGMNGRQLSQVLIAMHPEMAVLYMSGHPQDIIVDQGVLESGIAFIEKSFNSETLAGKVRAVLDEHQAKSKLVSR